MARQVVECSEERTKQTPNAQRPTLNVEIRRLLMFKRLVASLLFAGFLIAGSVASANPVGDFFRRLGNSIAHPQKRPRPRSSGHRSENKQSTTNASPTATPNSESLTPPSQANVRNASAAPAAKGAKRDVPYAIPVPGRPGLVTSPFAPDAGYVDVRAFPPGTEVQDPYSGKVFRTP
jgi:hypothetical protein